MPQTIAESLRQQAEECLRAAHRTQDPAIRNELIAAAAWLHDEAVRLEKLLGSGGGGGPGPGTPPPKTGRNRAPPASRPPPRYQLPNSDAL